MHWISAVAVLGLLVLGFWMTGLPIGLAKLQAYAWHKWIGLVVLGLTLGRLCWRWRHPPPALPPGLPRWQARLAILGHRLLLVLLLALPLSGWLMNSAAGVSLYWFAVVPLPDLVPRDPALFEVLKTTHHLLVRALLVLLALHLAAIVQHDVRRRDGILRRMWPSLG